MATVDAVSAAEEMMKKIEAHPAAQPGMPPELSVEYYRQLSSMCDTLADAIEDEAKKNGAEGTWTFGRLGEK